MLRARPASPVKKWKPASEEWVRVFAKAADAIPEADQRKMFGYPAAFVNGNMFAGLHESGLVLRLPERDREEFLKQPGARQFEPMPGRPMREYVVASEKLAARPAEVQSWVRKAFSYAASLPAKASKKKSPTRGHS
jgi:TfoX/Sxy family transcriptional regulator of competence genes